MKALTTVVIPTTYTTKWGRATEFNTKHTGKALGHALIRFGKRTGFLPKSAPCASCSKAGAEIHWHHDSYESPETVIPLCGPCHVARHMELGWGVGGRPRIEGAVSRQVSRYRAIREQGRCCDCGCQTSRARCISCTDRSRTTRVAPGSGAARRRKPSTRRAA